MYRYVRRKWTLVLVEDKHVKENLMFRKGCLGFLFEICLCLHCCIKLSVRVFDLMVREHEFTPPSSSLSWFVMSVFITVCVHVWVYASVWTVININTMRMSWSRWAQVVTSLSCVWEVAGQLCCISCLFMIILNVSRQKWTHTTTTSSSDVSIAPYTIILSSHFI